MKKNRSTKGNKNLRQQLAQEAARLMYEENVSQYFNAKRIAIKRITNQSKNNYYRPQDLPSNGEISDALTRLVQLYEGDQQESLLFSMRIIALDIMAKLNMFQPRLIGSVSTGRVRKGSDIDLHVFTDSLEELEVHISKLGWVYEKDSVSIQKNSKLYEYTHLYLYDGFPVELSVYPVNEIRITGRSSTDGKPIRRIKHEALQDLIMTEHSDAWERYLSSH